MKIDGKTNGVAAWTRHNVDTPELFVWDYSYCTQTPNVCNSKNRQFPGFLKVMKANKPFSLCLVVRTQNEESRDGVYHLIG